MSVFDTAFFQFDNRVNRMKISLFLSLNCLPFENIKNHYLRSLFTQILAAKGEVEGDL